MLPTVPESTRNASGYGRCFDVLSSIGRSVAGSGALAALAVCCLLFATGMNTFEVAATSPAPLAVDAVEYGQRSVPEVKRIHWIKNIVEEPMLLRRESFKQMDAASPLGLTLPLVSC